MLTPVADLITGALTEIRVARGGDVVRAEDQALGLLFLNEILERLAVTPQALYSRQGASLVLAPGVPYYAIGPTGSIIVPRRPVRINQATIESGTTRYPLILRSERWWNDLTSQPQSITGIPASLFYSPAWPDGTIGLYPSPSQPDTLVLSLDNEIAPVAVTDTIDLPQGYSELLRLWTAKKAAPSFASTFSAASQAALAECLTDICGTNLGRVNDADTRDGGVPGGHGGTYDYRTGEVS